MKKLMIFIGLMLLATTAGAGYNRLDGSTYSCNEIRVDIYLGERQDATWLEKRKGRIAKEEFARFCRGQ